MNYAILYGQGALDQLLELNLPEILDCVDDAMHRLADNPGEHGQRGRTVYPAADGGVFWPQEFDFYCDRAPGERVHCRAHFYFDLNERELCVINLVARPDFTL